MGGWLAEEEPAAMKKVFGDSENMQIVSETDAMTMIAEAAKNPIMSHPWDMAETMFDTKKSPYKRLTVWNQDANNCTGHGTAKAIDAFMLMRTWIGDMYEMTPFENFVPWVWGVGKNEAGQPGTGGATMGAMLAMITANGVLPTDTPNLPPYSGTSNTWARNYGKHATNAPYSQYWDIAKHFIIKVARLPQDADAFYMACKAGYAVAFGTSQRIVMQGIPGPGSKDRLWSAVGSWMHAMAAYGYNPTLDSVGIDNSHGDGFAWASKTVLNAVVNKARYFDAFVILGMTPRKAGADWNTIGRS